MDGSSFPILGTFAAPRATATAATAFFSLIPPFMGDSPVKQTRKSGRGKAHVTRVIYTTGGTPHTIYIARPLNFTTVAANVAANATSITLDDDPGLYSTNYKYSPVGGVPAQVGNNAIAAGDYIVVQLADGTWKAMSPSAVSSLVLTVAALPNFGVGINKGALCYFFGNIVSDLDPATGAVQPQTLIAASAVRDATWFDSNFGVAAALHEGDPLLFLSGNATAAGFLESLTGFYSSR